MIFHVNRHRQFQRNIKICFLRKMYTVYSNMPGFSKNIREPVTVHKITLSAWGVIIPDSDLSLLLFTDGSYITNILPPPHPPPPPPPPQTHTKWQHANNTITTLNSPSFGIVSFHRREFTWHLEIYCLKKKKKNISKCQIFYAELDKCDHQYISTTLITLDKLFTRQHNETYFLFFPEIRNWQYHANYLIWRRLHERSGKYEKKYQFVVCWICSEVG